MELSKELEKAEQEWQTKKDYERDALKKVYLYNLQFRETGNYPYNKDILNFILERESIPQEFQRHLETEIYLSQRQIDREKKNDFEKQLKQRGFEKVKWNRKDLDGKRIEFIIDNRGEMFGDILEKKGKLKWTKQGSCETLWAFENRHRRTGYPLGNNNVFIKVI